MKTYLLILSFMLAGIASAGQKLYLKTFGDPAATPVIFLHGGPGYNSANFEGTTARALADSGFYVVVYDRRGEGRSTDPAAAFTFREAVNDLKRIYGELDLKRATLVGHSFGGIVATLFAREQPEMVRAVVLVGAPVSLQESFRTIIRSSAALYQDKGDSVNLRYIAMLEKMDTASLPYSSFAFRHAMQNGFYSPKERSLQAKALYAGLRADTTLGKLSSAMTFPAPLGFHKNEHYTTINLAPALRELVAQKMPVYGLYGREDGLYSEQQVRDLGALIGGSNLRYLERCSHNVFIDQQAAFIRSLKAWLR